MIHTIHRDAVIGIKRLSSADLGVGNSSNQTHIGLFESSLVLLQDAHSIVHSQLIHDKTVYDLLSLLDFIENPDGSFRSPKIRKGTRAELEGIDSRKINSIVRQIRDISANHPNRDWYLLWLGLESRELVFLLFDNHSSDYQEITGIVGELGLRKQIDKTSDKFQQLINYLNTKVEDANLEYYEELEIAVQFGQTQTTKRYFPRAMDFSKAYELSQRTGVAGEELLFQYFEKQKNASLIKDFTWVNQSKETGLPYDFEITNLDNSKIYSDAKSTTYQFDLPIILSSGELTFINQNKDNYHIHRLYSIHSEPKLRICEDIHKISEIFLPKYELMERSLEKDNLLVHGTKLSVPPSHTKLKFGEEIYLKPYPPSNQSN